MKNVLTKITKTILLSASIFTIIGLNTQATAQQFQRPYKKVVNEGGVFVRDENCNKRFLLPQNSFVYQYTYGGTSITCNVNGVNYTLNEISGVGNKSTFAYGYAYTDIMVDAGPEMQDYVGSLYQQTGFGYAPLQKTSNVRDIACKKIGVAQASNEPGNLIAFYPYESEISCSINGEIYRMINVEFNGKSSYIVSTSF